MSSLIGFVLFCLACGAVAAEIEKRNREKNAKPPEKTLVFQLAGISYPGQDGPRYKVLAETHIGAAVELRPDPDNPEDPNAIRVLAKGRDVGFVPRHKTLEIRQMLDTGRARAKIRDISERADAERDKVWVNSAEIEVVQEAAV
jgi:hypothetical protein